MKISSSRLIASEIGDSLISIFKIKDDENYIISIQDIDSCRIAIVDRKEDLKIIPDGEGDIGKYVIIDNVTYKQLSSLSKLLNDKFEKKGE